MLQQDGCQLTPREAFIIEQFTTKLWLPPQPNTRYSPRQNDKKDLGMTVIRDSSFPFLDMRMEWD
eukprot:5865466-Ditylum_brightwellii.AAC.1